MRGNPTHPAGCGRYHEDYPPRVRGNRSPQPARRPDEGTIPACAGEPSRRRQTGPAPPDYPRVCGGTCATLAWDTLKAGLSPRVRGNHDRHRQPVPQPGTIPACAGEPCRGWNTKKNSQDYPRVCGGTGFAPDEQRAHRGLSPRVRGNLAVAGSCAFLLGTIPACAGEPVVAAVAAGDAGDYPRVCGGTDSRARCISPRAGLSPRVRGNLVVTRTIAASMRTIPACAGEPVSLIKSRENSGDYPRVCGGTRNGGANSASGAGLSPRVRGNPLSTLVSCCPQGTIPACAGEPRKPLACAGCLTDYPRVCGGTPAAMLSAWRRRGLSPRVRGNPARPRLWPVLSRTIPACAGEPASHYCPSPHRADYPRVCGGTPLIPMPLATDAGLSPRVRGNRRAGWPLVLRAETIPACAGEPYQQSTQCTGNRTIPACAGEPFSARVS